MRRVVLSRLAVAFSSLVLLFSMTTAATFACNPNVQSCSGNYQVDETFFGNGGELNACGSQFCAKEAAGETGVGLSCSSTYCTQAGFNSDRAASLTFIVNSPYNIDLGKLTPGVFSTTTTTFSVKTYLASGYQVVAASPPPQNGSYTMHALTTPSSPDSAQEEFGINLVANSAPTNPLGADPAQVPDSTFSFGAAAHNSGSDYYDTPNMYMYKQGDVIAKAARSSGETDYTISYIFNITNLTPGGVFTFNQVLVATSTF